MKTYKEVLQEHKLDLPISFCVWALIAFIVVNFVFADESLLLKVAVSLVAPFLVVLASIHFQRYG